MTPDMVNGGFECIGAVMLGRNVWQLYKDKIVRGVHWWATAFFASWGYWNLFYYPHLDQWFSFTGGIAIVAINTVWLAQMLYYNRRERLGYEWKGYWRKLSTRPSRRWREDDGGIR
ncbi:MAG: hypothetical protein V3S01_11290 [Dehalococcoidia bacterium]